MASRPHQPWLDRAVTDYIADVTWRNLAQSIEHDTRMEAYAHIQDLEVAYFEDRQTGGLLAIMNDDVNQLERFLDTGANDILQVLTTVVGIGIAFFVLVPTIAPFAFAPIPLILWGSFRFQRSLEPRYAEVRDKVGLLNSSLANNLGGIATIKAFTAEQREIDRIAAESEDYRAANREAIRLSSAFVPLIRIAILAGFTGTILTGTPWWPSRRSSTSAPPRRRATSPVGPKHATATVTADAASRTRPLRRNPQLNVDGL